RTASPSCHAHSPPVYWLFSLRCSRDHRDLHSFPTRRSSDLGAQVLAVALPEEGAVLREHGIEAPILVMGAYVPGTIQAYQRYSLMATISDFDQLNAAAAEARSGRVAVHLKVDTGMGRLGVLPQHALALAQEAMETGSLEVVGV